MNIVFQYLYSLSETEELSGEYIFTNPTHLSLANVNAEIEKYLIGNAFFIPNKLGIPCLDGDHPANEDADYHEYEGLEFTELQHTESSNISDFIDALKKFKAMHPEEFW